MSAGSHGGFSACLIEVARKDLRIELRSWAVTHTMMLFGLLVLFIFVFALPGTRPPQAHGPAVLWVTLLFASVIGMTRAFALEEEDGCLEALALAPADPAAIYLGKCAALYVQLLVLDVILLPAFCLLFSFAPGASTGRLAVVVALGTLGLAALGTLLGAMTARLRGREFLLSLLLFPLSAPLLLAAARGTAQVLDGQPLTALGPRLYVLLTFDGVFLVAAAVLFEFVLGGD